MQSIDLDTIHLAPKGHRKAPDSALPSSFPVKEGA